jgi:hypothetical protein
MSTSRVLDAVPDFDGLSLDNTTHMNSAFQRQSVSLETGEPLPHGSPDSGFTAAGRPPASIKVSGGLLLHRNLGEF